MVSVPWCALCVLCALLSRGNAQTQAKVVRTTQGPVRGYRAQVENIGYYVFYNIPYATAPTGRDRFKAPLPPPSWKEPFEAVDAGVVCPQANVKPGLTAKENCLITNIYVPDTNKTNLPVIVTTHGGAFISGYGNSFTYTHLLTAREIIVVNFNYRLGVHGFLCLGTEKAQGNAGLKDQIALLRWVQKNIRNFGGNPNEVTLQGRSAGAASVDLLMLSKASKGLFNKVSVESGANVGSWSISQTPIKFAKEFAQKYLNYTSDTDDDIKELEKVYINAPSDILSNGFEIDSLFYPSYFVPCLENNTGEEFILNKSPVNILQEGVYIKVPLLYGFTNFDGSVRIKSFKKYKRRMSENFSDFLPPDLKFEDENEKYKVAKRVKHFYFGEKSIICKATKSNFLKYLTDALFVFPMLRSAELQKMAGNEKLYLYQYTFVDETDPVTHFKGVEGAPHCAQSKAVIDAPSPERNLPPDVKQMKEVMRRLWGNFILNGKPTTDEDSLCWPPLQDAKLKAPHMELAKTVKLEGATLLEMYTFWDDIYRKHYEHPTVATFESTQDNLTDG